MQIDFQKILNNKKLFYFFLTIIIITACIIIKKLIGYSLIVGDDSFISTTSFTSWIKNPRSCNYISSSLSTLLGVILPKSLNMHPNDFMSQYFGYVSISIMIFLSFILNSFLFQNIKKNYFYLISIILMISSIFTFLQINPFIIFQYEGFFRIFLPTTLWFLLILFLIKNIQKKSKIYYFIIPFLTLFVCLSKEPMCISTLAALFLYSIILFFHKEEKKTFKIVFISFIISAIDFLILLKIGAFLRKTPAETIIDIQYVINIIKSIPSFTLQYISDMFINYIIIYILLITQTLFLLPKIKNDKNLKNSLVIICCFLLGTYIFFFSLVCIGERSLTGKYWTNHDDLQFIYSLLLFTFNLILLNFLIRYNLCKKYIISIIFCIISIALTFKNYHFYKIVLADIIKLKNITYKAEKILRLASINNKTAYLDQEILNWQYLFPFFVNEKLYIKFINQFEDDKNKIKCDFIFVDKYIAQKEFENNGGNFTKEELENINFNNLLHNQFIYNKQN